MGRDSVGLAGCAIAESKFEQGADITARMLALMARLNEIQRTGTPDIEFATLGLLARSQVAAGRARQCEKYAGIPPPPVYRAGTDALFAESGCNALQNRALFLQAFFTHQINL